MLALRRGQIKLEQGVVEAHGPLLNWTFRRLPVLEGGVAAVTLGHVVLARDGQALHETRLHERVHVRQYERWGPLFVPAYLAASLWVFVLGRDPYRDNWFEIGARREAAQ